LVASYKCSRCAAVSSANAGRSKMKGAGASDGGSDDGTRAGSSPAMGAGAGNASIGGKWQYEGDTD